MDGEGAECSRCGATFDTQDELIVHSMDTHAGIDSEPSSTTDGAAAGSAVTTRGGDMTRGSDFTRGGGTTLDGPARNGAATDDLDDETVERLLAAVEQQAAATGTLRVQYRQRFLAAAGLGVLGIAVGVSYLYLTGVLDTAVYTFALGTLFGLTLTYLQAFLQAIRG